MVEMDTAWDVVGSRVRQVRTAAGISVRELARRIGVSPSHVSQVERGLGAFSVPALYAVARELGVSIQDILDGAREAQRLQSPAYTSVDELEQQGVVQRFSDRPSIQLGSGPRWSRLTGQTEPDVEFLEVVYAPRTEKSAKHISHEGREYGVVLSGVLLVEVDGVVTSLAAGDSIAFDSNRPHRFWNDGDQEVRAIWFVRDRAPWDTAPHV